MMLLSTPLFSHWSIPLSYSNKFKFFKSNQCRPHPVRTAQRTLFLSFDINNCFRENSLKRDLSNVTAVNPPLFSLVNTFKWISKSTCTLYSGRKIFIKNY
jgi:hypothetical protein